MTSWTSRSWLLPSCCCWRRQAGTESSTRWKLCRRSRTRSRSSLNSLFHRTGRYLRTLTTTLSVAAAGSVVYTYYWAAQLCRSSMRGAPRAILFRTAARRRFLTAMVARFFSWGRMATCSSSGMKQWECLKLSQAGKLGVGRPIIGGSLAPLLAPFSLVSAKREGSLLNSDNNGQTLRPVCGIPAIDSASVMLHPAVANGNSLAQHRGYLGTLSREAPGDV